MSLQPSNLMNFPDAHGQYYHPTPTPQNVYGYTENIEKNEQKYIDYYYPTSEVRIFLKKGQLIRK